MLPQLPGNSENKYSCKPSVVLVIVIEWIMFPALQLRVLLSKNKKCLTVESSRSRQV